MAAFSITEQQHIYLAGMAEISKYHDVNDADARSNRHVYSGRGEPPQICQPLHLTAYLCSVWFMVVSFHLYSTATFTGVEMTVM